VLNGKPVAGFSEVSGLGLDPNVTEYRPGSVAHDHVTLKRGSVTHDHVTLKRGVAYDPAFAAWAAQRGVRQHWSLHVYDRAGRLVRSHQLTGATTTVVQIGGSLDPGANPIQIQHIKLENEGWTR
jgi:phage tail-like protein